jgi:hypothetical protein
MLADPGADIAAPTRLEYAEIILASVEALERERAEILELFFPVAR